MRLHVPRETNNYELAIPQHFLNMYSPKALIAASVFLEHEKKVLTELIKKNPSINNMVVIGSGPMAYLSLATAFNKKYIGVDPFYRMRASDNQNVFYFDCKFEALQRSQLPGGSCLFIFWFNVLQYLDAPQITIDALVRPGDIFFHSTWSSHRQADNSMRSYFREVYKNTQYHYKKAITDIRFKNNQLDLSSLLTQSTRKEQYENNINRCEIVYS